MFKSKLQSVLAVILVITAGTGALFASAIVDAGASLITQIADPGSDEEDQGIQIITGDPVRITETWTSGNCTCVLDWDTGVFTVSGNGAMANYTSANSQPWANFQARITTVSIQSGVTSIGNFAFSGCAVSSISLSDSVRTIGSGAFAQCASLTSVSIPSTVTSLNDGVFYNCTALQTAQISASVPQISVSLFDGCTSLTSVTLPSTITQIDTMAFQGCTALTSIQLPSGIEYIYGQAFSGCSSLAQINIPDSVLGIGEGAFSECTSLTSIAIPANTTIIDNGAFMGCYNMTSVVFNATSWNLTLGGLAFDVGTEDHPTSLHVYSINNIAYGYLDYSIGSYTTLIYETSMWISGQCVCMLDQETGVFTIMGNGVMADYDISHEQPWMTANRLVITSVVVGSGVTHIGALAFSGIDACTNLRSVDLGNTVQSIGNQAFDGCSALVTVVYPASLLSIGAQAFFNCSALTSAAPSTVTNYGVQAYGNCTSFTSIQLRPGVTYGEGVYAGCTSVSAIVIVSGVLGISASMFAGCTSIQEISIPSSVIAIGQQAFSGCTSLTTINILSRTWNITSIGSNAFSLGTSQTQANATVYSPNNLADGRLDAYKGSYTTLAYAPLSQYIVTITVNDSSYGSVDKTSITVPWGTQTSVQDNVLYLDSVTVTATPSPVSVEYTYSFGSWTGLPASGMITSDVVITANFTRTQNYYEVTFVSNDPEYGHLSGYGPISVPGNMQITASGGTITLGQTTITAIPTDPTVEYAYTFDQWTNFPSGGRITQDVTIGADFSRSARMYTVSIVSNDTSLGTVDVPSVTVPYNSDISVRNDVLTVGTTRVTATPLGTALFVSWDNVPVSMKVMEDMTITAHFEQLIIVFSDLSVNPTMYGVIGKPLPWTYDPFSVSLNVPVAGEWSINDPANTGLTINKKTGAFGGSVSSLFVAAGSALITVSFSPTGSTGSVSATFTLHYAPALIITS